MGFNSSKDTSQDVVYKNTSTKNPYVISKTTNKGTISNFVEGNAYDTIGRFVNKNVGTLLDEYLNPSLDSVTNKAKMDTFAKTVSSGAKSNLENNIINPLSDRNMIRSSQATNMYKGLSNKLSSDIADYANELLANSRLETADMLSNLLAAYMDGFNVVNANQNTSLATSKGNAKVSTGAVSPTNLSTTIPYMQMLKDILSVSGKVIL